MTKISCLTRDPARRLVAPLALACMVLAIGAAGCSTQEKVVYDPVNTKPIVGDDAMALRADWPKTVCYYPSGDVVAWSTRYPYQESESRHGTADILTDSVTFVAETALLPFELAANPPGVPQVYYAVKYPPTYTAQPPLPPQGGITPAYANRYSAQ